MTKLSQYQTFLMELLSFHYIGNEGIKVLSDYLSLLTTLTINDQICLDLSNNEIIEDGLYELSSTLSTIPNLEYLSLKNNSISNISDNFYESLNSHLTNLECLDIRGNCLEKGELSKLRSTITSLKRCKLVLPKQTKLNKFHILLERNGKFLKKRYNHYIHRFFK